MIKTNNSIKTQSFDLTAFLLSEQCELSGIEKDPQNASKLIFCFFGTDKVGELVDDFYSLKAFVKPQELFNAERTLRSIIRSQIPKSDT